MRSKWKGKFITYDYEMFSNKDFSSEYSVYNTNVPVPYDKTQITFKAM